MTTFLVGVNTGELGKHSTAGHNGHRRGWYKEFYLGGGWSGDIRTPTEKEVRKLLTKPD